MGLTQDVLLPILVAVVIVNAVLLAIAVVTSRRRDREEAVAGRLAAATGADDRVAMMGTGAVFDRPASGRVVPERAAPEPAEPEPSSGTDRLTGLPDATVWERLVSEEDSRVRRYRRPVTIVIIEMGGLDRLEERLVVDAGERILPAMADILQRHARAADRVARIGRSTFGVLLPETDQIRAINYIERVRRACEMWLEAGAVSLRLAIGWADSTGDTSLAEVQSLATDRMYADLRRRDRNEKPPATLMSDLESTLLANLSGDGADEAHEAQPADEPSPEAPDVGKASTSFGTAAS